MVRWHPKKDDQILVITSMNYTADLVAKTLFELHKIKDKVSRIYSSSEENIFNVEIKKLPEWSVIYQMIYKQ